MMVYNVSLQRFPFMYTLKKHFGQHFLHDQNMCRKIVSFLAYQTGDQVLEVGPGAGALTRYLILFPEIQFKAIEIDAEKVGYLNMEFPACAGSFLQADILQTDIPFDGVFSVIGNFPYNISSQILFRILEWKEQIPQVVGMFQREVAKRIVSAPGSKEYGILSVLVQAYYDVEYKLEVHENCFTPPPKVKSAVIRMNQALNKYTIYDKNVFDKLVKSAFQQRRKTLRNSLRQVVPVALLQETLFSKRAEELSVPQFVELANRIS